MGPRASKCNQGPPAIKQPDAKVEIIIPPNTRTMKALGIRTNGGVDVLEEFELPEPDLQPRDLLIRVEAVALNPVDIVVRKRALNPPGVAKVLGWDGAGVVQACGPEVTGFRAGDRVYFAGSMTRNGSNADLVAIDERIVARAPSSITATVAASVPLVTLTAWEGLESLGVDPSNPRSGRQRRLLVVPGAGGVGSYVIQLAKACGLQVITTASREESRKACLALGADFVINHREPLKPQLEKLGIKDVHFIFDAVDFNGYAEQYSGIIQPFGRIVSITVFHDKIEFLDAFKYKSVAIIVELMFTRSMFESEDMGHQGEILTMAAQMIDDKQLQTPIWKSLPWSLESLREAHELQASGKAIGKIVLTKASGEEPLFTPAPRTVKTMTAFGIRTGGGIAMLEELELPEPELRPRDLLIRVEAVALNPVDTKVRGRTPPNGLPQVLGWDGAGVVEVCGPEATGFRVGDRVYFAGAVQRNGSNADLVAIDERIVAYAPASTTAAVAASVPLVALTAWEGLEQFGVDPSVAGSGRNQRLLTIPGAGGVGSYIIQFAKAAGLQVIATASREESREACLALGADFVVNHREPLKPQLEKLGIKDVHFIYDAVDLDAYAEQFSEIIQPFGKIVSITMIGKPLQILEVFKKKSVSVAAEFMFTRPMFEPEHMDHQRHILTKVAKLIDNKALQTPIWKSLPWSLESLREAHRLQESGKAIGKIVMSRSSLGTTLAMAAAGKKVLIISTSASKMGDHDTGAWSEEICGPYYTFAEAGCEVTVCSISGGDIPIDAGSLGDKFKTENDKRMIDSGSGPLKGTKPLADFDVTTFDIVFFAGGHGTCVDFDSAAVGEHVSKAFLAGKVVAAVCHGPTCFAQAKVEGQPLVAGKRMAVFSDVEEGQVGLAEKVPFLLESKMKELGATVENGEPWSDTAVADGKLVTGQNPQSSVSAAKLALAA